MLLALDIQRQIRERVESGKYADADAVMEAALDQHEKYVHLKALFAVGVEPGRMWMRC